MEEKMFQGTTVDAALREYDEWRKQHFWTIIKEWREINLGDVYTIIIKY